MESTNLSGASNSTPLQVRHWLTQFIGLLFAAFFAFISVITWGQGLLTSIILILLSFLGLLLFGLYGQTIMDDSLVFHRNFFGKFSIALNEVNQIEMDSMGNAIVFVGQGKRLVIPGQIFWFGRNKKAMKTLFEDQIAKRSIPTHHKESAAYTVSKNTRVIES